VKTLKLSKAIVCSFVAASLAIAAGCGKSDDTKGTSNETKGTTETAYAGEPITITISWTATEDITKTITEHPYIKAKFPNIKFAYQLYQNLDEAIFNNNPPDIINLSDFQMPDLMKKNVPYDVTGLVKQNGYNLNVLPSEMITSVKKFSAEGKLLGLPDKSPLNPESAHTPYFTIYNKDIFDKFAVPYPKDNMTWDEYIDLGKRLTRTEGGTDYIGFVASNYFGNIVPQLGLQYAGASKKVDLVSDPGWLKIANWIKRAYEEQGNTNSFSDISLFLKGTAAMMAGYNEAYIFNPANYESKINWDMATFPRAKDKLEVPPALGLYVVTSQSKNKDAAFKAITAFLSDEMQKDRRVKWEDPLIKKRNTKAIRAISNSVFVPNEYTFIGRSIAWPRYLDTMKKGTDVNTAMREVQELLQQEVNKMP
jgi:multiple sugar transport system substrate-binding protein